MEQLLKDTIEEKEMTSIDDTLYHVIMHNDDVTPFDYVIFVLDSVFDYSFEDGFAIAIKVHNNGEAIIATLSLTTAYEKLDKVDEMNQKFGELLQMSVEKA